MLEVVCVQRRWRSNEVYTAIIVVVVRSPPLRVRCIRHGNSVSDDMRPPGRAGPRVWPVGRSHAPRFVFSIHLEQFEDGHRCSPDGCARGAKRNGRRSGHRRISSSGWVGGRTFSRPVDRSDGVDTTVLGLSCMYGRARIKHDIRAMSVCRYIDNSTARLYLENGSNWRRPLIIHASTLRPAQPSPAHPRRVIQHSTSTSAVAECALAFSVWRGHELISATTRVLHTRGEYWLSSMTARYHRKLYVVRNDDRRLDGWMDG